MKKKIIVLIALFVLIISATAVSANAPKIIVDQRELIFDDQGPVIVPQTGKTLIPLRFVLESVGAKVTWYQDLKMVAVDSGDGRNSVYVKIGSDEMSMTYFPSLMDTVFGKKTLEQVPVLMNDRTMIPVREVLEGIGAKVEWDEENRIINITSRAYTRYLRNMGVSGYEVFYPLAEGEVNFDKKPEKLPETPYNPKEAHANISISAEQTSAKKDELVEVFVNISNLDKTETTKIMTILAVTLGYDIDVLRYEGYELIREDKTTYNPAFEAIYKDFQDDSVKMVFVIDATDVEKSVVSDGIVAKIKFRVLSEEKTEIKLTTRSHQKYGMDQILGFNYAGTTLQFDDVNELYVDTTPIKIN